MSISDYHSNLPDQMDHLAKILRELMLTESVPRLQLSSNSEREHIRKVIDSGVDILANLKFYRNALASISFLPDELLADIFHKVIIAEGPWSTEWFRLITVCRRWHQVAMNHGRLWSWISEARHPEYQLFEDVRETRSKGYPLSFKFSTAQSKSMLIRNSHRVRLLEVRGKRSDLVNLFGNIKALPILQTLRFALWDSIDHEQPVVSVHVPSFLVKGGAPCLRHLSLDNVSFKSAKDLQLLVNLTHLELGRGVNDIDILPSLPSLKDIYHIIKHLPALQVLRVRHYARINNVDLQHLPPISLPVLRLLDLNMDIQDMNAILQFLIFPHSTHTSYIAHPRHDEHSSYIHDIKCLVIHMRRHLRHQDAPVLRSAYIECGRYLAFSFSDKEKCLGPMFWNDSGEPSINVLLYPSTQHENRQMIAKLINAIPLEKLVTLDTTAIIHDIFNSNVDPSAQQFSWETWRMLVRLLPIGLTIRIGVNNALLTLLKGAIDAMKRSPDASPSGRRLKRLHRQQGFGSLPLSKLVLIASLDFQFLRSGTVDEPEQERLYNGLLGYITTFRDLSTKLKPEGQPLKTLAFEELRLSYSRRFANRLYEVTGELSYDGVIWDPVEIRKQIRAWRKQMRRLRRLNPDLELLHDSDPDQSPLSSDEESS